MKALQIEAPLQATIVEVPLPQPGKGQVLVKVTAVTTCPQWDLHIYHGKPMFADRGIQFPYPPGQPGHEMTGVVAQCGEGTTLLPGQTVCAWKDPGHKNPGCYAEYVVMNQEHLIEVSAELPYSSVASLELAMCVGALVLKMKEYAAFQGKICGVNGLGPAGLIAAQMMKAEGAAKVIGIDPHPDRRKLARELGVAETYEAGSEAIPSRKHPDAPELSIDCVGYPQAVSYIMDRTRDAIGLFAVQREAYSLYHPGLTVIGYPGHYREAAGYALMLIQNKQLRLQPLITHEMTFNEYDQAVRLLQSQEAIKICFTHF